MLLKKFEDVVRDLVAVLFQREVAGVEQMNLRVRDVTLECFRAGLRKNWIVLSPKRSAPAVALFATSRARGRIASGYSDSLRTTRAGFPGCRACPGSTGQKHKHPD
jgi:hypothetical protein